MFVHDKFHIIKALFVLFSFGGVIIITLQDSGSSSDENEDNHSYLGDVFSLLSAVFYALYATYLKAKVPKETESEFKFTYFLGFVGLINVFLLLPLFPIFNALGIEEFSWPNSTTLMFLTLNALIGTFISDYCWARSVVLLGPLITTLGISLTIPLSLVSSSFFDHIKFSWLYLLGSAMILSSFLVIAYINFKEEKALNEKEQKRLLEIKELEEEESIEKKNE